MTILSKIMERNIADKNIEKLVAKGDIKAETRIGSRGRGPIYYTLTPQANSAA